jgi:hypothetical protein
MKIIFVNATGELQYKFMTENNLDVCGGDFISIDENNNYIKIHTVPKTKDEILITMANNAPFAHPTVMIKKEFLNKANLAYGVDGYVSAEDVDLWIKMYNDNAVFGNLNEILLKYRILSSSLSHINAKILKKEVNIQFNKFLDTNKIKYENAFDNVLSQSFIATSYQKDLVRAVIRYSLRTKKGTYIFRTVKKVKVKFFLIAFLSYLRSAV